MHGSLSVLNVGAGDIEVVFNQHDAGERERAIGMLKDMQARGYAILVRLEDGSYVRAESIDADRGRYIVQVPTDTALQAAGAEDVGEPAPTLKGRRRPRRGRRMSVPIEGVHAMGVARSAGG